MRLRVTVPAVIAALPLFISVSRADDPAHRADEARHAEETRRAQEAHHADEHAKPGAHHDWNLRDLEHKEKSGGKLSAEEKEAFERLKAERQKRYADLAKADADRDRDRTKRRAETQKAAVAHYRATDPAFKQEFQRDAEIVAQLSRAREVAQAEGRDDAVARVDKMLQKEKDRHAQWLTAHQETP